MNKIFQFVIEIDGIDQMLIQTVKRPKKTVGKVAHGGFNHDIKTAGGIEVSDAELEHIVPSDEGDSWAWDWMNEAQDDATLTGKQEQDYKKDITFKQVTPDGKVLNSELWEGCWPTSVEPSDHKRGNKNENSIRKVILSVDKIKKLQ